MSGIPYIMLDNTIGVLSGGKINVHEVLTRMLAPHGWFHEVVIDPQYLVARIGISTDDEKMLFKMKLKHNDYISFDDLSIFIRENYT